jgi:hypothetical protein
MAGFKSAMSDVKVRNQEQIIKEQAARIERLEAALREIDTISWTPTDRETYQDLFAEAQNIASDALEDKP